MRLVSLAWCPPLNAIAHPSSIFEGCASFAPAHSARSLAVSSTERALVFISFATPYTALLRSISA